MTNEEIIDSLSTQVKELKAEVDRLNDRHADLQSRMASTLHALNMKDKENRVLTQRFNDAVGEYDTEKKKSEQYKSAIYALIDLLGER